MRFDETRTAVLALLTIWVTAAGSRQVAFGFTNRRLLWSSKSVAGSLKTINRKHFHPLSYRPLDEDDDDANLLKTQSRAPPGYDLKRQLSNREIEIQNKPQIKSAMNVRLILALFVNQFLILGIAAALSAVAIFFAGGASSFQNMNQLLHWEGALGPQTMGIFNFVPTPERIGKGLIGAIPMLAVSTAMEKSDKRIFANINFSTISMCMTLFGRRKSPPQEFLPKPYVGKQFPTTPWTTAFAVSAALAFATGFCEEIVFRRLVPSVAKLFLGPQILPLMLLQAGLFAAGHVQPKTGKKAENLVLIALQLFNGVALGTTYLACGGDILPCIIAHTIYDTWEFFRTWFSANKQMEYAESEYEKELPMEIKSKVKVLFDKAGVSLDSMRYKSFKRLFYTFDYDKNKTLSLSEVRKGLSYLVVERAGVPPPTHLVDKLFSEVDTDNDRRLDFAEFVDLYFRAFKSRPASVGPPSQGLRRAKRDKRS